MAYKPSFAEPHLVGAAVALGLDIAMLVVSGLVAETFLSPAFGFVLISAAGLLVAPLVGWRYGPAAINRAPAGWEWHALRSVLRVCVIVIVGLVLIQVITVPVEGGVFGRLALIAYGTFMDTIVVISLALLTTLLLGPAWTRVMRLVRRPASRTS